MAKPWEELHLAISTDKELHDAIAYKGLTCLEVHAGWCGPCTAVIPTLKKLHWDLVEERGTAVQFVVCNSDAVEALKEYRDRSKPLFIIYRKGNKLTTIEGVNTYALKIKCKGSKAGGKPWSDGLAIQPMQDCPGGKAVQLQVEGLVRCAAGRAPAPGGLPRFRRGLQCRYHNNTPIMMWESKDSEDEDSGGRPTVSPAGVNYADSD